MKDKYFLDTNILIYSFDKRDRKKQNTAQKLISLALNTHRGIISTQVIQEFVNVATRKFVTPLTTSDCKSYIETILTPLCEIFPNIALYRLTRFHFEF